MADFISELANKSGVNLDMARKGLGAILAFFKEKLPADTFAKVTAAVPGSEGLMAEAEAAPAEGGVIHSLAGWAGKLSGGGGAAAAVAKLTALGFSAEQVKSFVPKVLGFLQGKLPPGAMKQISGLLPAGEEAAAETHS